LKARRRAAAGGVETEGSPGVGWVGIGWAMTWMAERPENGTENKVLYDCIAYVRGQVVRSVSLGTHDQRCSRHVLDRKHTANVRVSRRTVTTDDRILLSCPSCTCICALFTNDHGPLFLLGARSSNLATRALAEPRSTIIKEGDEEEKPSYNPRIQTSLLQPGGHNNN
jgi:hypothetical protein